MKFESSTRDTGRDRDRGEHKADHDGQEMRLETLAVHTTAELSARVGGCLRRRRQLSFGLLRNPPVLSRRLANGSAPQPAVLLGHLANGPAPERQRPIRVRIQPDLRSVHNDEIGA